MTKKNISQLQKALNLWAVILIVWSVYRAKISPTLWFDDFLAKPLLLVLPVYWYVVKIERKDFLKDIFFYKQKIIGDLIYATTATIFFVAAAITANYVKYGTVSYLTKEFLKLNFTRVIISSFIGGIAEEILSRGFVLRRLYEDNKNVIVSCFYASILFFFLHIPILFTNIAITGRLLIFFLIGDLTLSYVLSFLFLTRKSITLPIFLHSLYKIVIMIFI